jgi:hypothetical protein
MKGWKFESHRHMLASKGIKTLNLDKYFINKTAMGNIQVGSPGSPARLKQEAEEKEILIGGKGDNKPDSDFDKKELKIGIKEEMEEHGNNSAIAKEIVKDHLSENPHHYADEKLDELQKQLKYAQDIGDDEQEVKLTKRIEQHKRYLEHDFDESKIYAEKIELIKHKNELLLELHRSPSASISNDLHNTEERIKKIDGILKVHDGNGYYTQKAWWKTDKNESAKEYMNRNFEGHEKDGEYRFRHGVANMARHPVKDLDGEWKEYTSVASNDYYGPQGQSEKLSKDKYERTVQRGSALIGRIVTQANVEPIIDKNQDRSFRDIMLDIEFGRRT